MGKMGERVVTEPAYDGYGRLWKEVRRRWREPQGHPTYFLFFVGSFLLYAAAGVWLEFAKLVFGLSSEPGSTASLRTAIATYFPAVLGSSVLQLMISDTLRSLRALGQIISILFGVLAFTLVFATTLADWVAILIGIMASIASLACWWIVNADERSIRDEPMPVVATGAVNPQAPLLGADALNDFEA